ncbi:MAG: FtsX-like permease family protein [Acidobacteria bacterium]|nr:FtsX-like permease family protein [Acidobacteriota bacterium]
MEHAPAGAATLFIRTTGDPGDLIPSMRTALRSIEPGITLRSIRTMDAVMRESVQVTHLAVWLLGIFAGTALLLAAVGIYGVMAYAVRQRMQEIGTRMALGATPSSILWLVLKDGARIAATGAVVGLASSLIAGRALSSLLLTTSPTDPAILLAAASVLLLTALAACYFPARRATRVDPVRTLAVR